MTTQKELDANSVIALVNLHQGNLSAVAKRLGCARGTLYSFISKHATCQKALKDARETLLDGVESILYNAALSGEPWAVTLVLKAQGRSRGYATRTEITGADGGPLEQVAMTLEEWRRNRRSRRNEVLKTLSFFEDDDENLLEERN